VPRSTYQQQVGFTGSQVLARRGLSEMQASMEFHCNFSELWMSKSSGFACHVGAYFSHWNTFFL